MTTLGVGCFSPDPSERSELETGTSGSVDSGPASEASDDGPATPGEDTTEGDDDTSTPDDGSTGAANGCGAGTTCAAVPEGWDGPFVREPGERTQCDDGGLPVHFIGTNPALDDTCTCDCGEAFGQTCVTEILGGGSAMECGDNDTVLDTCTFELPMGPIGCEGGTNCFDTPQAISAASHRECAGAVANVVHPIFGAGARLCSVADELDPCEGGTCTPDDQPSCISAPGHDVTCPETFPVRTQGYEGFATDTLECPCACRDEAGCTYLTWYDTNVCAVGAGDDEPMCGPIGGRLSLLGFDSPGSGCAPVVDAGPAPEPPAEGPITMCCAAQ